MERAIQRNDGPDALGLYLNETRRFPLLSASEERKLARAYRGSSIGSSPAEVTGEGAMPEDAARRKLLERNLRLVVAVARRYTNMGLELSDLVQEGNLGLLQAVERFDPERGIRFSTYAVWWIRQAITRALTSKSRTIRVPIHQRELARKALRLRPSLGSGPAVGVDLDELAREASVPVARMKRALSTLMTMESLDAPAIEGGSLRGELLADERVSSPWTVARDAERRRKVSDLLDVLPAREQKILRMRYAIGVPDEHTLEQIGATVHLTRERVRQLERDALHRLRREADRRGLRGLLAD